MEDICNRGGIQHVERIYFQSEHRRRLSDNGYYLTLVGDSGFEKGVDFFYRLVAFPSSKLFVVERHFGSVVHRKSKHQSW